MVCYSSILRSSIIFFLFYQTMHKSIIFLFGSLVMLLPFGSSMNIISNAMAVEMNPDMNNEDYSQRYERFYKDDSFREAYYNYHKQHHQDEQQKQQSSYNDYYNYETDQYERYAMDMANDYADKYKSSYGNDNNNYYNGPYDYETTPEEPSEGP